MSKQVHSYVVHPETMGPEHCHADCPFLDHRGLDDDRCTLFDQTLVWDVTWKIHGNVRTPDCREKVK
jgi:hypothetical protein